MIVKKTLKTLLKTITNPIGQANDEYKKDKKFWTQDLSKRKNEEVELDEMAVGIAKTPSGKKIEWNQIGTKHMVNVDGKPVHMGLIDRTHAATLYTKLQKHDIKEEINMNLTPVQRKIRSIVEAFMSREDEVELDESNINHKIGDYIQYKGGKSGRIINKNDTHLIVQPTSELETAVSIPRSHVVKNYGESVEEVELDEVLGVDQGAGEWIHDFVHSDDPKFAGKSKEKRKEMALAAYYAAKRNEEVELDEWNAADLIARASAGSVKSASGSNKTTSRFISPKGKEIGTLTQVKGKQYTGADDDDEEDEIPSKQEAKRSTVQTSVKKGSNKITVNGEHNIKPGHNTRGHGFPLRSKVIDVSEDGKTLTMDKKSNATGAAEHTFGPGRGRPTGSESGARTHGAEGGIANKAIYGGHQYNMPTFSTSKFSK